MPFTPLKTNYKDDVLDTSVNQVRRFLIVNNPGGSISLTDATTYLQTGTFIGAQDLNIICGNMNTIMGYIETSSGDLAQEFQTYFNEQKTLFETAMNNENTDFVSHFDTYLTNFKANSSSQFTTWYDANTADWSQDVTDRINSIIQSLTVFLADNGQFVLNKAYSVGNIVSYNLGDGITRGYIVVNPVPANAYIYPTNTDYFANVTREGTPGIGLGLTPKGLWSDQITYVLNDLVLDNYIYWRCLIQNTDSKPSDTNVRWEKQWDFTKDLFTGTTERFDIPESADANVTITKFQNTVVDGSIPDWKLLGNTKVVGSALYGFEPLNLKSVGKNLFDIQDHVVWLIENIEDITVTDENGETILTIYEGEAFTSEMYILKCKENTQYTFSFDAKVILSLGDVIFAIYYSDGTTSKVEFSNNLYETKVLTSTFGKTISHFVWASLDGLAEFKIKKFQIEEGIISTTYEPYKSSMLNIQNIGELHKLDNGVTDILYSTGNKFQNIKKYTLLDSDVVMLSTMSNVDYVVLNLSTLSGIKNYGVEDMIATKIMTSKTTPLNNLPINNVGSLWKHYIEESTWTIIIPKGTYATLANAKTALAGTEIIYQLENVVKSNLIDELSMSGILQSHENGTLYIETMDAVVGSFISNVPSNLAASNKSVIKSMSNFINRFSKIVLEKINFLSEQVGLKLNKTDVVANYTTTTIGKAFDATKGKELKDNHDILVTNVNGKAPTSHYSADKTTYGAGSALYYGHVGLSDSTSNSLLNSDMAMAATPYAVKLVNDNANSKAPLSHASSATTYGIGTAANYGHVQLSDNYTYAGTAASGKAASSKALYDGLAPKQNAATAITTSNIADQYVRRADILKGDAQSNSITLRWTGSSLEVRVDGTLVRTL